MPHSRSGTRPTRKNYRKKLEKYLNEQLKHLRALSRKHSTNALRIKLPYVSLGELRANYKPRHIGVDPILLQDTPNFTIYQSSQDTPLVLYGSDDGFIAARFRLKVSMVGLLSQISAAIDALPPTKHYHYKGIKRSAYKTRHYGFWCAYMLQPKLTAEHRDDAAVADEFIHLCQPIFHEMTAILGGFAPRVFKEFQQHPLPNDAQRPCGAWSACAINNGGNRTK